jgi:hypothetical protein
MPLLGSSGYCRLSLSMVGLRGERVGVIDISLFIPLATPLLPQAEAIQPIHVTTAMSKIM